MAKSEWRPQCGAPGPTFRADLDSDVHFNTGGDPFDLDACFVFLSFSQANTHICAVLKFGLKFVVIFLGFYMKKHCAAEKSLQALLTFFLR